MNARTDMSDRGLSRPFKGLLAVVNGLNGLNGLRNAFVSACLFSDGAERISVCKFSHKKKKRRRKGVGRTCGCTWKMKSWRTYIDMNCFPRCRVGNSLLKFIQAF